MYRCCSHVAVEKAGLVTPHCIALPRVSELSQGPEPPLPSPQGCSSLSWAGQGEGGGRSLLSCPAPHPLCRQVLETCMKSCGKRFHDEVGKFRFLNELIKVVSPKVGAPG